jgi:hypothetical protein
MRCAISRANGATQAVMLAATYTLSAVSQASTTITIWPAP